MAVRTRWTGGRARPEWALVRPRDADRTSVHVQVLDPGTVTADGVRVLGAVLADEGVHHVVTSAMNPNHAVPFLDAGFRVRAERSGTINVTIGVPRMTPDAPSIWAVSPVVQVAGGSWQEVELPIAGFWSRVKADWEAAAISGIAIWGYGAGAFAVSAFEVGLQ